MIATSITTCPPKEVEEIENAYFGKLQQKAA